MKSLVLIVAAGLALLPLRAADGVANPAQTATFSVTSDGTPPLTYQWRKNGVDIPGATGAVFVIPSVQLSDAGKYTVRVSNPAGSCVSDNATLSVRQAPTSTGTTTTITVTTPTGTVTIATKQNST